MSKLEDVIKVHVETAVKKYANDYKSKLIKDLTDEIDREASRIIASAVVEINRMVRMESGQTQFVISFDVDKEQP